MPQHTVTIGGRSFDVVCQAGQEPYLESAASILDSEAQKLTTGEGRITESQLLLMSGLLLADRVAAAEEGLANAQKEGSGHQEAIDQVKAKLRKAEVDHTALQGQLAQLNAQIEDLKLKHSEALAGERQARETAEAQIEKMVMDLESALSA